MFIVPINGQRTRVNVTCADDLKEIKNRKVRYRIGTLLNRNFGTIVVMSYRELMLDMRHDILHNVTICIDNSSVSDTFIPEIKRKCLRHNHNLLFM